MSEEDVVNQPSEEGSSATDNSQEQQEYSEEDIAKALDEPEETVDEKEKEPQDEETKDNIQNEECPDKFKNKDGSTDINKVLKSYKELESMRSKEIAEHEKEKAELLKYKEQIDASKEKQEEQARNAGYESALDMQQSYAIANLEVNEYAKYLNSVDDPEEVRKMLINYANNPSEELMRDIELEFAPEINKRIGALAERQRLQFENQKLQDAQTTQFSAIENVINESVKLNKELFNYEPFKQLFTNTLTKYGNNFSIDDAKFLMDSFVQMKEAYRKEFEEEAGIKSQNNAETDKLSAINPNSSAPVANRITNEDIDKMSPSELRKEISKYI